MAVAIGLLAGLGNVAYRALLDLCHLLIFDGGSALLGLGSSLFRSALLPLLPAAGALLLIPLEYVFPGEVRGQGFSRFLETVHLRGSLLRARSILIKAVSSAITIGSGGSAGVEGPVAQIGGALGSMVGQRLKVSQERLQTLVACGVAAGIGGTFNAPIAGVFFAEEIVLLGSFGAGNFTPLVISSGVGTLVARTLEGNRPAFRVPPYVLRSPWEMLLYAFLGLLIAFFAVHFIRSFHAIGDRFHEWKAPAGIKGIVGAGLTGVIGIGLPQVLGNGYPHVEAALAGTLTVGVLLALSLAKMYATGLTLGSGNAGGIFAPCLFIGAMIGGAFGVVAGALFPRIAAGPGAYALVGMGGFLAAATHAPMTAIFLIFEMTNEYSAILPIMTTAVIGYSVSRHFQAYSIETFELARRGIHLEQGREVDMLRSIQVREVMSPAFDAISEAMPLREVLRFIPTSRHTTFPVVDAQQRLAGILSLQDLREVVYEESLHDIVIAKDISTRDVVTAFPDETLRDALAKIGFRNIEHLPVVRRDEPTTVLGMVSRRDIVSAYNKALIARAGASAPG
ncbi:MAG: chloride channel protein [Deltaproteobacteria bacterium]|nr:chloride channel protein [Deltaproteobacteria bacterium]